MTIVDIIIRKREGRALTEDQIRRFVQSLVAGEVRDYQAAAWLMAVAIQGMNTEETAQLTMAMAESGDMLSPSARLPGSHRVVDKHSTGGVGDKTSLVVGPLVAACGQPFGKMSGRGLGFSGGTVDKLESISGWRGDLTTEEFYAQLRAIGLVICGQSADLAPADRILYALRDVTGTVESLPLAVSSIMSKKVAGGAEAVLLDVKTGSGTFCRTREEAQALASAMVAIGTGVGRDVQAWITQMDQPLGRAVGNALEVREAMDTLRGNGPADFTELTTSMAAQLLVMGGAAASQAAARRQVEQGVTSGAALAKFRALIEAQAGDPACIDDPDRLPQAPIQEPFRAPRDGYVQAMQTDAIGGLAVALGAGRVSKDDAIDLAVGLVFHRKTGQAVAQGEAICTVHARSRDEAQAACRKLARAVDIGSDPVPELPVILERL